jgi:hypothetical protein
MVFVIIWAVTWLYLMAHVYATGTMSAKPNDDATSKDKFMFYGQVEMT